MGEGGFTHLFSFFCWLLPKLMGSMADFQHVKGFNSHISCSSCSSFAVIYSHLVPVLYTFLEVFFMAWTVDQGGIGMVVGFLSLPFWSSILVRRSSVGFGSGSFLTHLSSSLLIFIKVEHTDTPNTGIRGIKLIVIHFRPTQQMVLGRWKYFM